MFEWYVIEKIIKSMTFVTIFIVFPVAFVIALLNIGEIQEGYIYKKDFIPAHEDYCGVKPRVVCEKSDSFIFKIQNDNLKGEVEVNKSVYDKFSIGEWYGSGKE